MHHPRQHTKAVEAGGRILHLLLSMGMSDLKLHRLVGHHQELAHHLGFHVVFDIELEEETRVLADDFAAFRYDAGDSELPSSNRDTQSRGPNSSSGAIPPPTSSYVSSTTGSRADSRGPPPPLAFDIPSGYLQYGSQAASGVESSRNTQEPQRGRSPSSPSNYEMTNLATTRYHSHPFPFIRITTIAEDLVVTTEDLLRGLWCLPPAEHQTHPAIRLALPPKPAIG